jgi:hypothetical protein
MIYSRAQDVDLHRTVLRSLVEELTSILLRSAPIVVVMQSTHHRHLLNLPLGLDIPRLPCIYVDPQVSPLGIVVVDVALENPPQMCFTQNDHMIETFPSDTAHQSFHESILPRRLIGCQEWVDAECGDSFGELFTELRIAVPQKESGRLNVRESISQLLTVW